MSEADDIFVDFGFTDDAGHIVLIGWTSLKDLSAATLKYGTETLSPSLIDRFARADLQTPELRGFMVVFRSIVELGARPGQADLAVGGATKSVALEGEGERQLVEFGVDEAFHRYLLHIAWGTLAPRRDRTVVERIEARLTPLAGNYQETSARAAAFDRSMVAPNGHGFVGGWILHGFRGASDPVALTISSSGVSSFRLFPSAVQRPDLSGFADRFIFEGGHGFVGAYRLGSPTENQPVMACLLFDGPAKPNILVSFAEEQPGPAVLHDFCETVSNVSLTTVQKELYRALTTFNATRFGREIQRSLSNMPGWTPRELVLVLEVDVDPGFMRDLILRITQGFTGKLRIFAIGDPGSDALERSLLAVEQEIGDKVQGFNWILVRADGLEEAYNTARVPDTARVIFSRLSSLPHAVTAAETLAGEPQASVVVHTLSKKHIEAGPTRELGNGLDLTDAPAVVVSCPSRLVRKSWSHMPRTFLTVEAHFRLLAEALVSRGDIDMLPLSAQGLFEGHFGAESYPVGRFPSRRHFDRAMRRAIGPLT